MIDKQYGHYALICDCCDFTIVQETWQDAVDAKKADGWISKKYSDGWKDLCPDCQD